jgi:hypothetical protein
MSQELFVEETVDLNAYKNDHTNILLIRGVKFITKTIELNSLDHFTSSFKVNGNKVNLTNGGISRPDGKELIYTGGVPANKNWSLIFSYNFNKSLLYGATKTLLNPLRSECDITRNRSFSPISDLNTKNNLLSSGGYYSTCHPDSNDKLSASDSDVAGTFNNLPSQKRDTWNEYFSYRKEGINTTSDGGRIQDAGNFYGIKKVRFYASGCIKFYIKQHSSLTTWDSVPSNVPMLPEVSKATCGGEEGWSYYSFEVGDDILSHEAELSSSHPDKISLIPLIKDGLTDQTKLLSRPDFMFNGTTDLFSVF